MVHSLRVADALQLAAGLLATRYDPLMVLAGTMTALTLLSAAAIYLGGSISKRIKRGMLSKIAGTVFIAIGLSFLLF